MPPAVRVVIDTNVLVSALLALTRNASSPPLLIFQSIDDGGLEMLVSPAIMDEYRPMNSNDNVST